MSARLTLLVAVLWVVIATIRVETEQTRPRDPEWIAPTSASTQINPLAGRPELSAGGRKLFLEKCSTCHGEDGHGTDRAPDLTAPDARAQSDGALFWKVSSGNTRAGMPTFSFLPALQRWQIVMYLRQL